MKKAEALVEMHFAKGENIIQQGEAGNTFYILYEGQVAVVKDGKEETSDARHIVWKVRKIFRRNKT